MKVGFTCGAFDLVHAGHVAMFKECKKHCDYLIVGLHTNPSIDRQEKNKPVQSVFERWLQLDSCKFVDCIIPYDTEADLQNLFGILDIDVRFIGEEYRNINFTGKQVCEHRGIEVHFNTRTHTYSSSELRKRIKEN